VRCNSCGRLLESPLRWSACLTRNMPEPTLALSPFHLPRSTNSVNSSAKANRL